MSKNTVERYLDLLSKVFVIFRLGAFSRNLRKEVTRAGKWYYYDVGIRNAIISDFNALSLRQDVAALWENYLISERVRQDLYHRNGRTCYFWRTYDQQEIDLVEESGGSLAAYEFKWKNKKVKVPRAWSVAYPDAPFQAISRENYLDFILMQNDEMRGTGDQLNK